MKINKLKKEIAIGLILIIIGIALLLNNYIVDKREEVFSSMNLELSEEIKPAAKEEKEEVDNTPKEEEKTNENTEPNYEAYVGTLKISKIGFEKGFYGKGSYLNNVKFNIKILDVSAYPDEENGNVIIIGHSGNYSNSYFANLYQLNVGDTASIIYGGKTYTYKIVNIYKETKDGTVTVYRDESKNTLTLITCTKDDETSQTIYISELVNVE